MAPFVAVATLPQNAIPKTSAALGVIRRLESMNNPMVRVVVASIVASLFSLAVTSVHFMYWADVLAGYSNYLVSMVAAPLVSAFLFGIIGAKLCAVPIGPRSTVFLFPIICTLLLILALYLVLQYGAH